MPPVNGYGYPRKRCCKLRGIHWLGTQTLQHLSPVVVVHAHLYRVFTKQRHLHLLFQRYQRGIGPSQGGVVGHISQPLRTARVQYAGRTQPLRPPIGKCLVLLVATSTRLGAIARQTPVIKKMATQIHLGLAHRIALWHLGYRKMRWQHPLPALCRWLHRIVYRYAIAATPSQHGSPR